MKSLSAPWRWPFISGGIKMDGCPFCSSPKTPDEESLILLRGRDFFILLNKYPYSSGHLMIVPFRHLSEPGQLPAVQATEMWELLQRSLGALQSALHPEGFNIGMNLGKAAGAGVKDHFHLHVVPRWSGDANFMPVVGQVRVHSFALPEIWRLLRDELAR